MKKTILIPAGIAEKIIHFKSSAQRNRAIFAGTPQFLASGAELLPDERKHLRGERIFSPASQVCTAQRTGHAPFLRGQSRCASAGFLVPNLRFCALRHGE